MDSFNASVGGSELGADWCTKRRLVRAFVGTGPQKTEPSGCPSVVRKRRILRRRWKRKRGEWWRRSARVGGPRPGRSRPAGQPAPGPGTSPPPPGRRARSGPPAGRSPAGPAPRPRGGSLCHSLEGGGNPPDSQPPAKIRGWSIDTEGWCDDGQAMSWAPCHRMLASSDQAFWILPVAQTSKMSPLERSYFTKLIKFNRRREVQKQIWFV